MEPILLDHVFPRHIVQHRQSDEFWYKSKFHPDMSEEQVRDAIVEGISYPTYEFREYEINNSGIKGYQIYKRLSKNCSTRHTLYCVNSFYNSIIS